MEELPEELVPVLECTSSAVAKVAGLAETEQVTLGQQRASTPEDIFTLLRCTPNHHAARLLPPRPEKLPNDETSKETKDEETFCFLKEHSITLPVKTFPASVVKILMRKRLQLILFEPGRCHITAFTTEKKVRSLSFCETNLWSDGLCIVTKGGFYDRATELLHGKLPSTVAEIFTTSLEGGNMEKHRGNKQILPKSVSENKCLDKNVDDKCYQKNLYRES